MLKTRLSLILWRVIPVFVLSNLLVVPVFAQHRKHTKTDSIKTTAKKDTTPPANVPQPYEKVITKDAIHFKGLFAVSKVKDRYYFEIPDSLLDRDIHVISRISSGPAQQFNKNGLSYAGDDLGDTQINFGKIPGSKLALRQPIYKVKSDDTSANGMYRAVANNNLQPILSVFDIKAYKKDSTAVIDVTDYLNGDLSVITGDLKKILNVQGIQTDQSYINGVHAYPMNVDVEMQKTYSSNVEPVTLKLNTSFVLLPKTPMPVRYADERVGYLTQTFTDFDAEPQRAKMIDVISRWRLQPTAQDMARYLNRELVEPAAPIIFYIDPATPKKLVPYLIQAVNDWRPAFEKAGFKNAISAREVSTKDTNWNSRDDRFNTIVYAPSLGSDVKTNLVIDPRSGEILHANIHIDHNVMVPLHDLYMIQAGTADPNARIMEYNDTLMGDLMRSIVSENVGIALGLVENARSSSTVSVEKIRDKNWVQKHGFGPSIMQGTVFNYVAQPADHLTQSELTPQIGEYDRWAIDWGYRILPQFKTPYEEIPYLRRLIADSLKNNPMLAFGAEPKEIPSDPRAMNDDLGSDPVKASYLGLQNLKLIIPQLQNWTILPEQIYTSGSSSIGRLLNTLTSQFYTYMNNVTGLLGTAYYNPHGNENDLPVYSCVPVDAQKNALVFLNESLFKNEPDWLISKTILKYGVELPANNYVQEVGKRLLSQSLLDLKKLKNINADADRFGVNHTLSLATYLETLTGYIWPELSSGTTVSNYHMILQRTYLNSLGKVIETKRDGSNTNTIAITRGHIISLKKRLVQTLRLSRNESVRNHYSDLILLIDQMTDPGKAAPAQSSGGAKPGGVDSLDRPRFNPDPLLSNF